MWRRLLFLGAWKSLFLWNGHSRPTITSGPATPPGDQLTQTAGVALGDRERGCEHKCFCLCKEWKKKGSVKQHVNRNKLKEEHPRGLRAETKVIFMNWATHTSPLMSILFIRLTCFLFQLKTLTSTQRLLVLPHQPAQIFSLISQKTQKLHKVLLFFLHRNSKSFQLEKAWNSNLNHFFSWSHYHRWAHYSWYISPALLFCIFAAIKAEPVVSCSCFTAIKIYIYFNF